MDQKQLVILALQVSIVSIVFSFGLRSTTDDVLYLVRRPVLLLRSWLAVLVIMPVLAVALTRLFDLRNTVEVSLIALAISPMPPLLPRKEVKAAGRMSYALALMATMALLSVVAVPLAVELLARYSGRPFEMPPGGIARIVLVWVLLPLLAGLAVRGMLPGLAERLAKLVGLVATVLLVLGLLALLTAAWPAIWAAAGDGTSSRSSGSSSPGWRLDTCWAGPIPTSRWSWRCRPLPPSGYRSLDRLGELPRGTLRRHDSAVPDRQRSPGIPYLAWRRRRHARQASFA